MSRIEDECLAFASEIAHIHASCSIHLHHILHSPGLLGESEHGGNLLVLELLDLDGDLVLLEDLLHDAFDLGLESLEFLFGLLAGLALHRIDHVCIDTLLLSSCCMKGISILWVRITASIPADLNMEIYWLCCCLSVT